MVQAPTPSPTSILLHVAPPSSLLLLQAPRPPPLSYSPSLHSRMFSGPCNQCCFNCHSHQVVDVGENLISHKMCPHRGQKAAQVVVWKVALELEPSSLL